MIRYNWIRKLGKSLVPSDFYIHVLQEKIGRAIGYMMLFILLLSLAIGGYHGYGVKTSIENLLNQYASDQLPTIALKNGELSVDSPQPIIVTGFDTYVILDGNGTYSEDDQLVYDSYVLFGKTAFSIVQQGVGPVIYPYSDIFLFDMTMTDLVTMLKVFTLLIIPLTIVSQFLVSTISFFINSLMILLVANMTRTMMGLGLKLKQLYHMTIYAMTFSVFWYHFTAILPKRVPPYLDTFVYYVIPSLILLNVFMMIRRRAIEEFYNKRNK